MMLKSSRLQWWGEVEYQLFTARKAIAVVFHKLGQVEFVGHIPKGAVLVEVALCGAHDARQGLEETRVEGPT